MYAPRIIFSYKMLKVLWSPENDKMRVLVTSVVHYLGHRGECCKMGPCIMCSVKKLSRTCAPWKKLIPKRNEHGKSSALILSYSFPKLLVREISRPHHGPCEKESEKNGFKGLKDTSDHIETRSKRKCVPIQKPVIKKRVDWFCIIELYPNKFNFKKRKRKK